MMAVKQTFEVKIPDSNYITLRTSAHNYTHAICVRHNDLECEIFHHEDLKKNPQYYGDVNDPEVIARWNRALEINEKKIAELKEKPFGNWFALTWCGSPALAMKAEGSARAQCIRRYNKQMRKDVSTGVHFYAEVKAIPVTIHEVKKDCIFFGAGKTCTNMGGKSCDCVKDHSLCIAYSGV